MKINKHLILALAAGAGVISSVVLAFKAGRKCDEIGGSEVEFRNLGNKDIIYNRGLISYNQDRPLNISIKDLKSQMAKK